MKSQYIFVVVMFAVIFCMILPQGQAKVTIKVSDIPKPIAEAVEKLLPGATITRAKKVDDHGEYDIYGSLPGSRTFKIDFNDWKLEKIVESFPEKIVPKAIMASVRKASPGCKFANASKNTNKDGKGTYEIEVKTSAGNKDRYFFNPAMVMVASVENMTADGVPASVKKTIAKAFPGSTIKDATKKTAREKVFYELDITGANRSHILWTVPEPLINSN